MRSGRKSYILIVSLFLMIITSMMVAGVTPMISRGFDSAMSKFCKLQAFYQAQRGVYKVIYDYMATSDSPYTASYDPGDIAGTRIKAGSRAADLFLVSTARVQLTGTAATGFTLSGVGLGNVSDSSKSFSVAIESASATGSAVTGSVVPNTISLSAKEFRTNAMTITYGTKPAAVVATFTSTADGSSRKAMLWDGGPGHAMFNDFVIKSTARVTAAGVAYKRTIIATYDVGLSRIMYLSESRDHLF